MFAICFTDQCLARLKQSFSLFPPRKLLIWAVKSSIAQSHYCISNDVKAKCRSLSRKFHGEMKLFASAFAKPMKILARLCLFDKPIKCFAFLFTFCFYVYFSRLYESRSIAGMGNMRTHRQLVARQRGDRTTEKSESFGKIKTYDVRKHRSDALRRH